MPDHCMDRTEFAQLRTSALADAGHLVGTQGVDIRSIEEDGELIIVASVADKTARPAVLQIIQRYFPGVSMRFEP